MHDTTPRSTDIQASRPSEKPLSRHLSWHRFGAFVPLCVGLVLTACASVGAGDPQQIVRQRATERWKALMAGEFTRAYGYTTPGFRAIVSVDRYRNRFGSAGSWVGSEVISVDCPEKIKCNVRLRIDFTPVMARKSADKITTHIDETWLLEDGQWWLFLDIKGN